MHRLRKNMPAATGFAFLVMMGGSASLLGSAQNPPGHTFAPDKVHVTEQDRGQTVRLHADDILVVSLQSDPSGGMRWVVDEVDGSVVRQLGRSKFHEAGEPTGSGVRQTLRFVGVSRGKTPLTLGYGGPHDNDDQPVRSYTIEVETEGAFHCH